MFRASLVLHVSIQETTPSSSPLLFPITNPSPPLSITCSLSSLPLLPSPPQIPFCLRWSSSSSSSLSSTRQSAPVPARLRWLSGTTCLLQLADQGNCLRQGTASVEMWSCSRATSCMDVEGKVSVERCFLCGGRGTGLCKEVVL